MDTPLQTSGTIVHLPACPLLFVLNKGVQPHEDNNNDDNDNADNDNDDNDIYKDDNDNGLNSYL